MKQNQMKQRLSAVILVIAAGFLMNACVYNVDLVEVARAQAERRRGPLPESEWNKSGLWQRVGDSPATYIPRSYARSAPRTENAGSWVVDQRDGKRFFVPKVPLDGMSPGVWMGEAKKNANWPVHETTRVYDGILVQ